MANSNRESGEIARRPYPTTLKGLLVEISIEATVFSSILIIGGFLFGDPDFFDGDHIEKILGLGHLIITFIFFLIVPPLYKLWNYTILLILIRMTVKKYLTKFSMIRNICIVGVLWPLCFWIFFMMVFITDYEESLDLFLVSLTEFDFGVAFFPATGMFAACLAPILTYRLTGYCFDSDFSLPPWSHGRWGFGKPARAQAEPASAEAGSDTPVPRDTGGGM